MALIRYPGSKAKLADQILKFCPSEIKYSLWSSSQQMEYREPFFGSGEMGIRILQELDRRCSVWLADIDPGMVSLWRAVAKERPALCKLVHNFKPSVEAFFDFKKRDGLSSGTDAEDGFRKLALHRMSVSGFGAMSGGPIGGKSQENTKYTVECRWTPERITCDAKRYSKILNRFAGLQITKSDFRELVESAPANCFIYLDPPYYEKGGQLYKFNMSPEDHEDLASRLRSTPAQWVLSYDDHPEIRRLYSWARIEEIAVTYSNAVCKEAKRPKNKEVVILPN